MQTQKKHHHVQGFKKEIIFKSQEQLTSYLIDSLSKVRRLRFNLKSVTSLR